MCRVAPLSWRPAQLAVTFVYETLDHYHWTSRVPKWQAPCIKDLLWYCKDNWFKNKIKFFHIFKEDPKFLSWKGKTEINSWQTKKGSYVQQTAWSAVLLYRKKLQEEWTFLPHCFKSSKSFSIFTPILSFQKIQFLCTVFNLFKNKKSPMSVVPHKSLNWSFIYLSLFYINLHHLARPLVWASEDLKLWPAQRQWKVWQDRFHLLTKINMGIN